MTYSLPTANTVETGIIQVLSITKEPRSNHIGRHLGVKVKDLQTGEVFWFNYYNFEVNALTVGGFYKFNFRTEAVLARVKPSAK